MVKGGWKEIQRYYNEKAFKKIDSIKTLKKLVLDEINYMNNGKEANGPQKISRKKIGK